MVGTSRRKPRVTHIVTCQHWDTHVFGPDSLGLFHPHGMGKETLGFQTAVRFSLQDFKEPPAFFRWSWKPRRNMVTGHGSQKGTQKTLRAKETINQSLWSLVCFTHRHIAASKLQVIVWQSLGTYLQSCPDGLICRTEGRVSYGLTRC